MKCVICKKSSDEVKLFDGIFESEIVHVCESCSINEGIPIIRKPSEEQLRVVDVRQTVRERMEYLTGRKTTPISEDQSVIQGHIAKLRVMPKKQYHEDLLEDYSWRVNMARRRKKITRKQLAEKIGTTEGVIQEIEKGKLPSNFKDLFIKLEEFFNIKLLKKDVAKIHYIRAEGFEEKILEEVKKKMKESKNILSEEEHERKKVSIEKIKKGNMDFSNIKDLEHVTLNDLIEMKRRREKNEGERKRKEQTESLIGEDLDLDDDI